MRCYSRDKEKVPVIHTMAGSLVAQRSSSASLFFTQNRNKPIDTTHCKSAESHHLVSAILF